MKKFDVVGLMSGTSLDGLDIAFVRFLYNTRWTFEVIQCQSIPYENELIKHLGHAPEMSALELKKLDIHYGKWIGERVKEFNHSYNFNPELIVSHGHTVFHQPEENITLQIGCGYHIMLATGIKTVSDLRSLDVALGGQGAPLVPIGDKLLFDDFEMCLNLGGFSNISFNNSGKRIAYDICPVNTVLNKLANRLNLPFDDEGRVAKSGITNSVLLEKLNSIYYYLQNPPKSLGIEWVVKNIYQFLDNDTPANLLNTFCHHMAFQINQSIDLNYSDHEKLKISKMLITGGGAKNKFLIDLIKSKSNGKIEVIIPDVQIVDFKEAIIFAFLGLLRTLNKVNTLKSVTGARIDSSGGVIFDNLNK